MNFNNFSKWFRGMGGRVPEKFEEVLNTRYTYDPQPVSSFKDRAEYIKKKYNYKFTHLKLKNNFLDGEPDINNITFIKK